MIVVNELGFSERSLDTAFAGEGFYLIIVFDDEKAGIPPDRLDDLMSHLRTRLCLGGRLVIATGSEGIGTIPRGLRQHSWTPIEEATK